MMKNDVSMISALDWSFLVARQSVSLSNGTKSLCKRRTERIHLKYMADFLPSIFSKLYSLLWRIASNASLFFEESAFETNFPSVSLHWFFENVFPCRLKLCRQTQSVSSKLDYIL